MRLTLLRERLRATLGRGKARAGQAGRALLAAGILGAALVSGRAIEAHARTSPSFALKDVTVTGNARLSRDAVLRAAGVKPGANAFSVSPDLVESRLAREPWIRAVEVERRLPGTLRIAIVEKEPRAVLLLGDSSYLVSSEADIIRQLGPGDPADLPAITGMDRTRFTDDLVYRRAILSSVVSCLEDYRLAGLEKREPVQEVHVGPADTLSLYVGKDATRVELGKGPFRRKLRLFRNVLERLGREHARPAYVYLDNERNPDRVTLRLR